MQFFASVSLCEESIPELYNTNIGTDENIDTHYDCKKNVWHEKMFPEKCCPDCQVIRWKWKSSKMWGISQPGLEPAAPCPTNCHSDDNTDANFTFSKIKTLMATLIVLTVSPIVESCSIPLYQFSRKMLSPSIWAGMLLLIFQSTKKSNLRFRLTH